MFPISRTVIAVLLLFVSITTISLITSAIIWIIIKKHRDGWNG